MNTLKHIGALVYKDVLIELRSREVIWSMVVFAITVLVIFNFIFDPGTDIMQKTAPGILWVAIIFSSNLGLNRTFVKEQEAGNMQGILLTPMDRSAVFLAKMLANVIFISAVQVIMLPVMIILYDLPVTGTFGLLLLVLFLGILGFASVGTLFSAIAANTKSREIMLPILLLPVTVPVILGAIKSTQYLLSAEPLSKVYPWMRLLIGFDVIFFVVCYLLYEYVIEE